MSAEIPVTFNLDGRGLATLNLNRPQVHNAFDDQLIEAMIEALEQINEDPAIRALQLGSEGGSFSAGADLRWMWRMAGYSRAENRADAGRLALLLRRLDTLNKPTIARVQGPAYGGGVGLIACCDIAISVPSARFALTEVRLGLVPAVISPYVIAAIGERAARRYFLTAERFDATQAAAMGLIHQVVDESRLDDTIGQLFEQLLLGGPGAISAAKSLISAVSSRPKTDELIEDTVERITRVRGSDEGREGLNAFLEKRTPTWVRE